MTYSNTLAHAVLVITAAVLGYVAWNDLRQHKIRNELIIVLAVLFVFHAIASGQWVELHWNFVVAFLMFLIMLIFYIRKGMGGGDIKLLTIAFLWVGYTCILPFAILLLFFTLIYAILAKLGVVNTVGPDRRRIPYAPAIAAALIGTFILGCLDRPPASHIAELPPTQMLV
jgi:prepilin peptidase CpaA